MSLLDVHSDVVPVSPYHDPIKIREEDHEALMEVQQYNDALAKYRQEMGRIVQVLNNLTRLANETEGALAEKRRALVAKYDLESLGEGQWTMDFEQKEFVRLAGNAPVIP
jgi:hypothetical protein